MKNNQTLILNTGGTFNKTYDPVLGKLIVPSNNKAIKSIIRKTKLKKEECSLKGLIYKDSLNMTNKDRKKLVETIKKSNSKKIIIVHGTDTMNKTAQYLSKDIQNKQIILTGAMVPFSIDSVEATSNFMASWGFLQSNKINGVYISMHGFVKNYKNIKKNKQAGVFECH